MIMLVGSRQTEIHLCLLCASEDSLKGIPFAQPPVGNLRWVAPQLPSAWNGTRDATRFAKDCLQWDNSTGLAFETSEGKELFFFFSSRRNYSIFFLADCLYLNVWTPKSVSKPLPTMIFFYGGSWSWGGTQIVLYDAERIMLKHQNVVVVTVNYR